jgi:hypothetical protein
VDPKTVDSAGAVDEKNVYYKNMNFNGSRIITAKPNTVFANHILHLRQSH